MLQNKKSLPTFRSFTDPELLAQFCQFLSSNNIEYSIEDGSPNFDPSFAYNDFTKISLVKVQPSDFEKIYELEDAEFDGIAIPEDHFFNEYTTEELKEILIKREEWNAFDFQVAKQILKNRGENVSNDELKDIQKERLEKLYQGTKIDLYKIVLLYLLAIFGGIFAIIIGVLIVRAKKVLPNGEVIQKFDLQSLFHAKLIIIIGTLSFIISVLYGKVIFPSFGSLYSITQYF